MLSHMALELAPRAASGAGSASGGAQFPATVGELLVAVRRWRSRLLAGVAVQAQGGSKSEVEAAVLAGLDGRPMLAHPSQDWAAWQGAAWNGLGRHIASQRLVETSWGLAELQLRRLEVPGRHHIGDLLSDSSAVKAARVVGVEPRVGVRLQANGQVQRRIELRGDDGLSYGLLVQSSHSQATQRDILTAATGRLVTSSLLRHANSRRRRLRLNTPTVVPLSSCVRV